MSQYITEPWHEAAIEMMANPLDNPNVVRFCEEHGVSPATYYRWRSDNYAEIYQEANKRLQRYMIALRLENYRAIVQNLKKSFNDRKLMAQLLGDLVERTETKHEFMTPDQKREKINQLLNKLAPSTPSANVT